MGTEGTSIPGTVTTVSRRNFGPGDVAVLRITTYKRIGGHGHGVQRDSALDRVERTAAGARKEDEMSPKWETWLILSILFVGTLAFVPGAAPPTPQGSPRPTTLQESYNCKIVSCAAPQCLDGEHLEVPPGQCCPVCVPD